MIGAAFALSTGAYLLDIGTSPPPGCVAPANVTGPRACSALVALSTLSLDGRARAFGALRVQDAMNVNIGPAIQVEAGKQPRTPLQGGGVGAQNAVACALEGKGTAG
eukprot:2019569-Pleurochrysis_carterae.AAC.3